MPKPNILFIMTDQQRWDAVGCSGGWAETPNLDRIAREGIRFSNCVTPSPVCISARLTLATGLYPHNTGVWNNCTHTLAPETPNWMRAIRDAGYSTSLFGKTHLHPHQGDLRDREPLMQEYGLEVVDEIGGPRASARCLSYMTETWERAGLWEAYREDISDRFRTRPHTVRPSPLGLEHYYDVYVGRKARQYLAEYEGTQPWFCWISFGGPHEPWDCPEPYASRYDPLTMPAPARPFTGEGARPAGKLDERMARPVQFEDGEVGRMRADYAGEITLIDDQIGEVLKVIEERGEMGNTLIAFTSDHGEMNGDHGLIYKSNFLNGAVRVPLILRTPGTAEAGGAVNDSPVEMSDLGPTLAELAGAPLEHEQFARSLCPVLDDPTLSIREDAISEISGEFMLLTPDWKVILNQRGEVYVLFDVHNDPQESGNLAGLPEMKAVENRLRLRALERLMQSQRRIDRK